MRTLDRSPTLPLRHPRVDDKCGSRLNRSTVRGPSRTAQPWPSAAQRRPARKMAATASMLFLAAGGTPGRDQLGAIAGGYDACGSGSRRAAQRPQWWVIGCGCCSLLEHRSTDPYALDVVIGTLRTLELLPSTGHSRGLADELWDRVRYRTLHP